MPRSEDYLDSLLDSITNGSDYNNSDRKSRNSGLSESQFLAEFEKELEEDISSDKEREFLREFEKEIGVSDDLDIFESGRNIDVSTDIIPKDKEINDIDDLISAISAEESSYENSDVPKDDIDLDEFFDGDENESQKASVAPKDVATGDAGDDILSNLSDILEDSSEESSDEASAQASDSEPNAGDEEDIDVLSDTPEEESAVPTVEELEGSAGEAAENAEGEGGNISNEEIMDIGNLLDSIDEEGNLTEAEMGQPAAELRDDEPDAAEGGEAPEEKQSFIQKLLSKLPFFKKKDGKGSDEESEEEEEEASEEAAAEESTEEVVDKKAAKAEAKAAKKKAKEEAKKKAKADKEKAAKNKAPKEKKAKKPKVPDKSPKIPIKVIIPFVLLAASLVVLWNVFKDSSSYTLTMHAARSSYDKGYYQDAYELLSGIELNEDDGLLLARTRILATLELRLKTYEIFSESQNENHLRALDALVQGAVFYLDHEDEALELAVKSSFDELGRQINDPLESVYGLTPEDANELMNIRDRKEYTRQLYFILNDLGLWSLEDKSDSSD